MIRLTAKVDGMMCGMCEAHACDAVRNAFNVKKVTASHKKNELVIISEEDIDEQKLLDAMKPTGYIVSDIRKEPYVKKGLFSRK